MIINNTLLRLSLYYSTNIFQGWWKKIGPESRSTETCLRVKVKVTVIVDVIKAYACKTQTWMTVIKDHVGLKTSKGLRQ